MCSFLEQMEMDKNRILVIEDDKDILTVLIGQLKLDGFEVQGALTGKKGIEILKTWIPDLVILDLNLPDIDGINICQSVRRISDIPIVILTARETISDKVRGLESGADDYIVKPFEYLELAARIRACLRRTASVKRPSTEMVLGKLKILLSKRQVFLNEKPLKLTKREYDLLELFVSHPGEVLSRDFICSHIWPKGGIYSWSRALDVHILRLRHKIEPDPENPSHIITHPGIGYRFEP